jgi:hypothetical protein
VEEGPSLRPGATAVVTRAATLRAAIFRAAIFRAAIFRAAILLAAVLSIVATSGCRAIRAASGNDRGEDRAAPAAVIAGRPVSRDELVDFWFERSREAYAATLDDLVDERIAAEDAARWGIGVPPEVLARSVAGEVRAREEQLRAAYGAGADLAAVVREGYGVDVPTWSRTVLEPRLKSRLLLQRSVRMDGRLRAQCRVRVMVATDPAEAARLRDKLAQGADFALTALRESKDASGKDGGALPPIARGDLAWPGVEERLFAAPVGSLLGPLEVVVDGVRQWHLYRVVSRTEPWAGTPGSFGPRLEKDLAERPAERGELESWRLRVRRERGVRYLAPDGTTFRPPLR